MTTSYVVITVLASALAVFSMRYLPFAAFAGREIPELIRYLGKALPPALMGMLVIYCLKGLTWTDMTSVTPSIAGILATAVIHIWKKNTILSIAVGTIVYMLLLHLM